MEEIFGLFIKFSIQVKFQIFTMCGIQILYFYEDEHQLTKGNIE